MTNSELLLLESVCQQYFGITERIAKRKAALGLLPVPAFRLSGTRRGPLYVRKADIDAYIEKQAERYMALNSKMQSAGLV